MITPAASLASFLSSDVGRRPPFPSRRWGATVRGVCGTHLYRYARAYAQTCALARYRRLARTLPSLVPCAMEAIAAPHAPCLAWTAPAPALALAPCSFCLLLGDACDGLLDGAQAAGLSLAQLSFGVATCTHPLQQTRSHSASRSPTLPDLVCYGGFAWLPGDASAPARMAGTVDFEF